MVFDHCKKLEAGDIVGGLNKNDNKGPVRIQRRRSKGWRMPPNTVYVGRGSKWGNPFSVDKYGRDGAIEIFRNYIDHPNSPLLFCSDDLEQLRGKNLACWCSIDVPCHADMLLELANE